MRETLVLLEEIVSKILKVREVSVSREVKT